MRPALQWHFPVSAVTYTSMKGSFVSPEPCVDPAVRPVAPPPGCVHTQISEEDEGGFVRLLGAAEACLSAR